MYSVIIPIYNSEEYLVRCIDSVLAQTASDFELILVDDGSKDRSGDICKKYQEKDSRIKYIRKENAGVSAARNTGIEYATGDYIGFIDSDDEILPDMYENLLRAAQQSGTDIVICDAITVYSDGRTEDDTIPEVPNSMLINTADIKPEQLLYMAGAAWRCLYRKTLFDDKNVRFPVGIKLSEDRIFNILAMGSAKGIYYIKKQLYRRYVILGSAVNKYHKDYFKTVINAALKTKEALEYGNFGEDFLKTYGIQTANGAMSAVYNEFHKDSKKRFSEKISSLKQICGNEYVQEALNDHGNGVQFLLMKKKRVYLLAILARARSIIK